MVLQGKTWLCKWFLHLLYNYRYFLTDGNAQSDTRLYLQVDRPELHDIEPLYIPGVELEETEVGHKTVDLLFYGLTISGVRNITVKYPPFWLAWMTNLKGGIAHCVYACAPCTLFQAIYNMSIQDDSCKMSAANSLWANASVVKAKTCQTSAALLTARTLITAYFRKHSLAFPIIISLPPSLRVFRYLLSISNQSGRTTDWGRINSIHYEAIEL